VVWKIESKKWEKKAWDEVGYIAEGLHKREHMEASFFASNKAAMIMRWWQRRALSRLDLFLSIPSAMMTAWWFRSMMVDAFSTGCFLDFWVP
jgi:hypothetical protein